MCLAVLKKSPIYGYDTKMFLFKICTTAVEIIIMGKCLETMQGKSANFVAGLETRANSLQKKKS